MGSDTPAKLVIAVNQLLDTTVPAPLLPAVSWKVCS